MRPVPTLIAALAAALTFGSSGPAAADMARPKVGIGVGEHGTFGAGLRFRVGEGVSLEAGVGAYYYHLEDSGERTSGFVPAWGAELTYLLPGQAGPGRFGVSLLLEYQEVLGMEYGMAARYERPLGSGGLGMHGELGMLYAPDGGRNADDFFEDRTGQAPKDLDYRFFPMLLKVGLDF